MLTVVGCALPTGSVGMAEASFAPPELGIATDEKLQVIAIQVGSAAEKAGVQVGDVLVSLTLLPSEPSDDPTLPEGFTVDDDGTVRYDGKVITEPIAIPAQPLPAEEVFGKEPILFTSDGRARSLISYGAPLTLQIKRNEQPMEIVIVPVGRGEPLALPETTAEYY